MCPFAGQYAVLGAAFRIDCAPASPVHWLILAVVVAGLVALGATALSSRKATLARWPAQRWVVLGLSGLTALLIAWAGLNPRIGLPPNTLPRYIALVVDLSDSVTRGPLAEAGAELAEWVRAADRHGATTGGEDWQGAVLAAGDGVVRLAGPADFASLAGALDSLDRLSMSDRPPGQATDLAAALVDAGALITESEMPGAVILLSDGLETRGDAAAAAGALGRRGIPVFVAPFESPAPAFGLVAADVPGAVDSQAETTIRAVLANPGAMPVALRVAFGRNDGAQNDAVASDEGPALTLGPGRVAVWRQAALFDGAGLQFGTLHLRAEGSEPAQERTLFTLVQPPIRLLSLGDATWANALPPERFQVSTATELTLANPPRFDPARFDVVVINGVPADALDPPLLAAVEGAVRGGTGLLLLNGAHPRAETEPTVILSYERSRLGPLLPVTSDPRVVEDDPPPREVIIVIDTSSSMVGWKLDRAREIGQAIIDRLTWRDTARILTFQTGVQEGLPATAMDAGPTT